MQDQCDIKAVLFDLGGVLCRLHDPAKTFGLKQGHDEFMRRWLMSPAVREFECGAIAAESFAKRIVLEAKLDYNADEFLRRFGNWPDQLFPGTLEILESIPTHIALALLSNTNAIHWERADICVQLEPYFNKLFLSYKTGKLKPDTDAFEDVALSLKLAAEDILFFDDNPLNAEAAKAFGMRAVLVRSPEDIKSGLVAHFIPQ